MTVRPWRGMPHPIPAFQLNPTAFGIPATLPLTPVRIDMQNPELQGRNRYFRQNVYTRVRYDLLERRMSARLDFHGRRKQLK